MVKDNDEGLRSFGRQGGSEEMEVGGSLILLARGFFYFFRFFFFFPLLGLKRPRK
jgi:hypothetical protein